MLGRHGGDANVDVQARHLEPRRAVLRQPPLGDVEAGENLDARNQRLRQRVRRRGNRSQQAVDAHAHIETIAHRFDVNVARPKVDRFFQEIVDGAHDRRAAGEVAQAVDAFFGGAGSLADGRRRPLLFGTQALRQGRRDIVERGDGDHDRTAEHDLGAPLRDDIGRIGDSETKSSVACVEGKHHGLAQEASREAIGERRRCKQIGQS